MARTIQTPLITEKLKPFQIRPQKSPLYKAKEPVLSPEPAGSHAAVTLKHVEDAI